MNHDPFESGKFGSLGTFKGAYYDDDSTEIGSDDLDAAPQRLRPSPLPDAQARWITILVVAPIAVIIVVAVALLISRF